MLIDNMGLEPKLYVKYLQIIFEHLISKKMDYILTIHLKSSS